MNIDLGALTGRVALVTGAAGVIGAATSRALARAGSHVVLADHAQGPLDILGDELGPLGQVLRLDLTDPAAIAAGLNQVGRVDILVNNAGMLSNARSADATLADWGRVQAINVEAALLLIQGLLPGMRAARWGRVVNMAAYAAKSGGLTAGAA